MIDPTFRNISSLFALSFRNDDNDPSRNYFVNGTLLVLRQFFANENPLKMMKNAFYFNLKALLVLKIFKFLP